MSDSSWPLYLGHPRKQHRVDDNAIMPDWIKAAPARVVSALRAASISTKEGAIKAIQSGEMAKTRGCGKVAMADLCSILMIDNPLVQGRCPCCGRLSKAGEATP